ncbi:hypothetical protein FRC20_001742 [Serendipita sp. 405]|nr:hypothetical protein FRC20_001742 [Serendipita sp. 405]
MSTSKVGRFCLLAVVLSLGAVQAAPGLTVTLTGDQVVNGADNFNVKATLQNTGTDTLNLYNEPRGLLSPAATDSFIVSKANGDGHANFVGLTAKYVFDLATSFTTLTPGQSIDVTHNLAKAYEFSSTGTYTITPDLKFFYKDESGNPVPLVADLVRGGLTAKLTGEIKSRHVEKRNARSAELRKRAASFANCTPTQENTITQSTWVASLYVANAEKYLTLHTSSSERYTTWFGEYDSGRHDTVLEHYTNIRSSDLKTYTYDCACTEGTDDTFAYVFPNEFGHIYLCNQYMLAEISGTDSKAGTIVHESSHFTKNAGTLDIAYGKPRAQALAQSNATAAINNADSHEYFAEDTPALA